MVGDIKVDISFSTVLILKKKNTNQKHVWIYKSYRISI